MDKLGLMRFKNSNEFYNLDSYFEDVKIYNDGSVSAFIPMFYKPLENYKYLDGYGKTKFPTSYKVRINRRYYRVYSDCYSNVASLYVIVNKQKHFIN